jgi:hypothetical protein
MTSSRAMPSWADLNERQQQYMQVVCDCPVYSCRQGWPGESRSMLWWQRTDAPMSHELRNELVEELIAIGGAEAVQNWT